MHEDKRFTTYARRICTTLFTSLFAKDVGCFEQMRCLSQAECAALEGASCETLFVFIDAAFYERPRVGVSRAT